MAFYSFVVWAPAEVQIRGKGILLEPGVNTFNIQTGDVDELVAGLQAGGVRIHQQNRLDVFEAVDTLSELGSMMVPALDE